jgi:hypothetical protein
MADRPSEPAVDARLRDYLSAELRQAELDFPHLPRRERLPTHRGLSMGVLAAAFAVLAFVVVAPRFLERALPGTGGTPIGVDGIPLSINGEPVARGNEIGSRPSGASFLAGGTLVIDTSPCVSRSPRAQLGCGEGWQLVAGPIDNPSAVFALDGIATAPGFVRTTGAATVARVHAWATASGDVGSEILVVEAIAWRQPTKGPVPENATPPEGGETNDALWPDFVSVWGSDGVTIAGYAPKRYLLDPGSRLMPGTPSNPPQPQPVPVFGEDLATLVGHMVPGVGFVALGSSGIPTGPSASVGPSVAPSPPGSSPASPASAAPSGILPPAIADCGRITSAACAQAIALARAGHEAEVAGATHIVVDDTCPSTAVCDRLYPFDSVVVFVTAGADTTGWYTFHVYGLEPNAPTKAEPWLGAVPAHVVQRLLEPQPTP